MKVGDIVEIPIDEARSGYGQIVELPFPGKFWLAVFERTGPQANPPELKDIVDAPVTLLGLTLDALLWHGRWHTIGHLEPTAPLPERWFQVAVGPQAEPHVMSESRGVVRPADAVERTLLRHRVTFAPIIIENALKAKNGIGPWRSEYDELTIEHVRQQARIVTNSGKG